MFTLVTDSEVLVLVTTGGGVGGGFGGPGGFGGGNTTLGNGDGLGGDGGIWGVGGRVGTKLFLLSPPLVSPPLPGCDVSPFIKVTCGKKFLKGPKSGLFTIHIYSISLFSTNII
jgi:hypothetical protein